MEVRPPKDAGPVDVAPQRNPDHDDFPAFTAGYPDWVDVPPAIANQLHRQGWERRADRKAAKTRKEHEQAAPAPVEASEAAPSGEEG